MQNYNTGSVIPFPGTSTSVSRIQHVELSPELTSKIKLAQAVSVSETSLTVNELAKLLKQRGTNIGQNRLYARLRADGYLCRRKNIRNLPTQTAMNSGLFEIKESPYSTWGSAKKLNRTVMVTPKGLGYLVNKYSSDEGGE